LRLLVVQVKVHQELQRRQEAWRELERLIAGFPRVAHLFLLDQDAGHQKRHLRIPGKARLHLAINRQSRIEFLLAGISSRKQHVDLGQLRVVFQQLLQRPGGGGKIPLLHGQLRERQDGFREIRIQCQRIFERGFGLGVFAVEQITARK